MADPGEKETGYVFCDFFVNEFLAQALILANHALAEEEFQEEYLFRNNQFSRLPTADKITFIRLGEFRKTLTANERNYYDHQTVWIYFCCVGRKAK